MIRMSKETDYGIMLLAHLAGEDRRLPHSARQVAHRTHLPLPMVSKVLKVLTRRGLLVSRRGAKGGYSLARRGERISVAEVISALEGPVAMTECIGSPGDCRVEAACHLRPTWERINDAVLHTLNTITLSDLARPAPSRAEAGRAPLVELQ